MKFIKINLHKIIVRAIIKDGFYCSCMIFCNKSRTLVKVNQKKLQKMAKNKKFLLTVKSKCDIIFRIVKAVFRHTNFSFRKVST